VDGPAKVSIYDPNVRHLWNRLHAALYVRTAPDGKTFGEDGLDPLLWPSSKYLLTKLRYQQAIDLLDEFLNGNGEKLIQDPLKRAVLQHDLWSVFDWLAESHAGYSGYRSDKANNLPAERRALAKRLAQAIQRLALSREQIRALPDNYAAAVAAKVFPVKHDLSAPGRAFLPVDLLEAGGPWVMLTADGLAAPQHVESAQARSAFFVLMNVPGGKNATLAYLQKLNHFPNPLMFPNALMAQSVAERNGHVAGKSAPFLNPDLPQFPPGTQFALVRQMMLIDDQGAIRPTRLIEDVQLRFFRAVPRAEDLPAEKRQSAEVLLRREQMEKNDFYEFQLRRKDLFAGKAGGLRAIRSDELLVSLFSVHDEDLFEGRPQDVRARLRESDLFLRRHAAEIENLRSTHGCNACHGGPGIHGVLSYRRFPSPELQESNRRDQEELAIHWKWHRFSWGFLHGLLESQQHK
jgi:hypothetical protein